MYLWVLHDVIKAIKHFLDTSDILKEVNNNILALMPNDSNHSTCYDFRPIAYYNTIYKCI